MNIRKGIEINYTPNDFQQNIKNIVNKKIDSFEYFSMDYIEEDYHIPIYFVIYETVKDLKTGSYGLFTHDILTKCKYYLYKYSEQRILVVDFGINGINKIYDIDNNFIYLLRDKINTIEFEQKNILKNLRESIVINQKCIIHSSSEISY